MSGEHGKVANVADPSGRRRERCGYCLDDGWVVVDHGNAPRTQEDFEQLSALRKANPGLRYIVYGEALAPCPHCEQGHANEYSGYYGEAGWWQGREALKAELRPTQPNPPLPQAEAIRRLHELHERLGGVAKAAPA